MFNSAILLCQLTRRPAPMDYISRLLVSLLVLEFGVRPRILVIRSRGVNAIFFGSQKGILHRGRLPDYNSVFTVFYANIS